MNKYKKCIIVVVLVLLGGCGKPLHRVYGTESMEVYLSRNIDSEYGKFEYYITDGTSQGWILRTNKKYSVGDKLYIGIKNEQKR